MAEEVIGLLFGVEGVGVNGASGQEIVRGLTKIVNEINSGKSSVPKIKFNFDTTEATKAVADLKKQLKDIEKIASIKVTYSNGGKGGGVKSGGITSELQAEMKQFINLQKQISSTKMKIGKLEIDGGNVELISAYTQELERLESQYDKLMQTFMKKLTGNPTEMTMGDINEWSAQLESLKRIEEATVSATRAKKEESEVVEQQNAEYKKLANTVAKYYKSLKEGQKLVSEYGGITRDKDGNFSDTDGDKSAYKEKIKSINEAVKAFRELNIEIQRNAKTGEMIHPTEAECRTMAANLGITTEQYKTLIQQVISGSESASVNAENVARKAQNSWVDYASKVRDEINRTYATISKNPEVRELANEIMKMASASEGDVGDLKNKFDELRNKIHETGADVETWGDKFKKTFAGNVRSALAGAITASFTKYLREVYQNVVKLDGAMTDLQIASGKTREEVKELTKGYADLAKQLGATTAEVAEAADTWLRQGYSIEETNTLIKNSTMLSKLGQIEATEASTALTSAMKGYKVSVEDSVGIVDKLTAVDMEAAASAGGIATAMAETATSADIAGVSMDKLIGYIATVKEVTQDADESIGTFYKTLFARMNNVAAGNFVDEETGESLNDVETVLNELGIKLRDVSGEFRNSGEVLDEVAGRWESFDSVSQHAIATAFAGTRQQEKFIVLMENYGNAIKYSETAANAAGTALEKYDAYTESIEGKINSLTAAFEEFSMTFLNSDLVVGIVEFLTWILEALDTLVGALGGLNTALYATVAIIAILKADSIVTLIMNICGAITKLIGFFPSLIASIKIAKAEGISMGQFIKNAFYQITAGASTAQLAVAAFVAVISVAIIAFNAFKQSQENKIRTALESAEATLSEAQAAKEDADSLDALIKKYEELAEKNNGVWDDKTAETVKGIQDDIVGLVGDQALALDLVNGKLETELGILKDISGESNKVTLAAAESALTDAKSAIQSAMKELRWGDDQYYDIGIGGLKSYGNIKTETVARSVMGAGSLKYDTIKVKFDTAEEFAAQYEAVQEYKNQIAGTIDETNASELFFYEELNEYLAKYKDVYDTYASARDLINELTAPPDTPTEDAANELKGVTVALKSAYDILEEVQDGYDGLAKALTSVTSEGYLTADALSTLFKLESDNALAGLKLEDILIRDANGYKLAEGSLQKYVQALIAQYTITEAFDTLQDRENAIANLRTLQAVLATLAQTQEDATDADKAYREELEKQQDAYNDQLDAYRELIDLRKDLLQTYEEELSYQKELAKRQRNVTALQTKLAVARLDQSAAGQARVRELEAELKEAQDDLEDFTLEHAIDVLSNQLESQYAEYEAFIKSKLDEIANILDSLDVTPEVNINTDTSWVKDTLNQIETLITETNKKEVVNSSTSNSPTSSGTLGTYEQWSEYWYEQNPGVYGPPSPMPDGWTVPSPGSTSSSSSSSSSSTTVKSDAEKIAEKIVKFGNASGKGMNAGKTGDNGIITWNGKEYKVENKGSYGAETNLWKAAVEILGFSDRQIFGYDGYVYGYLDGKIQKLGGRYWSQTGYNNFVNDVKAQYGAYHTGGLVGDIATLSSNEEFAKLLKGEFVSTPAQMKRFMEETLPQIANYSATGGTNEFNAPLIEITCESVTTEALPELERIVNEAVKKIQKQLDSGMSRTGFKRTPTKRLTNLI